MRKAISQINLIGKKRSSSLIIGVNFLFIKLLVSSQLTLYYIDTEKIIEVESIS